LTTLPTWVAVVLGLAPAIVAVVAIVADSLRERGRRQHEMAKGVREERVRAYATFARLTKWVDESQPYKYTDLAEAHAEIELLADDAKLREEAGLLLQTAMLWRKTARDFHEKGGGTARKEKIKAAKEQVDEHRAAFVRLAKKELGR